MVPRRLWSAVAASLCGLTLTLVAASGSAGAATQLGSGFGTEAGELEIPIGVALDQATGDVYVGDENNNRVDKFNGSGFSMAWGWGVSNGANEPQTCTVASLCQAGTGGTGAGQFSNFSGAAGVAVDQSTRDVYVTDFGNDRVQKFSASGQFLLMFGGHVNEAQDNNPSATEAQRDVCVAGEACTHGTAGSGNGEFEWAFQRSYIGVGPAGRVYVGDNGRVQIFEASGAWREAILLAGSSASGKVTALAVDSTGDIYLAASGTTGVHVFEPSGLEKIVQFDAGSTGVESIALNAAGDLFVGDSTGGFHVLEFGPAGEELMTFGRETASASRGMVFGDTSGKLYASDGDHSIWVLEPPAAGPLIEQGSEAAMPERRGASTLEATVNPEGAETTYHFQYVDDAHFKESGYATATNTPDASMGSSGDFEDHQVSAHLTTLSPGVTYHWHVVASNAQGSTVGVDESFQEIPAALVEGPWVADVAGTSATLATRIDPLGASTEYRLEYGTSTSYGHTLSGSVGSGEDYVQVSYHRQDLELGTTYHYRLVAINEVGVVEGADHTFTTQTAASVSLPDGRAWELVSPPMKKGALIEPYTTSTGRTEDIQAADDGTGIAYISVGPHLGTEPAGKSIVSDVLSTRSASGWASRDITLPMRPLESLAGADEGAPGYYLFSPDLSLSAIEPTVATTPLLSPEATERTPYLRESGSGAFLPLVTAADVPSGTKFGGNEPLLITKILASTPDLKHIIFESPYALTTDAASVLLQSCNYHCGLENLYEWDNEQQLQLINILPDGEATHGPTDVYLGGRSESFGTAARVISDDGRWVAWTVDRPYFGNRAPIYVRDITAEKTYRVGGVHAFYQTMSSDGGKIFFVEDGELYEFDTASRLQTDITVAHGASEGSAGVQEGVSDVSADGSSVYFVATGVLADGATSGADNLYMAHYDGGAWSIAYVTSLSQEDQRSWYAETFLGKADSLMNVSSRTTPDGRYLAFMSDRPLTGYDNRDVSERETEDAVGGQTVATTAHHDEEVFLYDAEAHHLACVSCNPTGARPTGVFDFHYLDAGALAVDRASTWEKHWLAGSLPGWDSVGWNLALYQPRYLSSDGRLFFESAEALVPQDTNGLEDVYEYEPQGVGDCVQASATFNAGSDGCVRLISSGTSSAESAFYDASESGDDVFFNTVARLSAADYDTSYDVYDAHACSAHVPCVTAPVSPPPCTSGDSCKVSPSPQPEIFGPAPSATFSGTGNVTGETGKRTQRHRPKRPKKRSRHKRHRRSRPSARNTHRASKKGGRR